MDNVQFFFFLVNMDNVQLVHREVIKITVFLDNDLESLTLNIKKMLLCMRAHQVDQENVPFI